MFYCAVVQAVLLFGAETWVLLAEMSRNLEGVHVILLRQLTGQKAARQRDRTWRSVEAVRVPKEAGIQTLGTYIEKRQATVAEWVALRTILEICDREMDYEGRGRHQERWWRQMADQKQLLASLEEILAEERTMCWESGRHGNGGGGREVAESDAGRKGNLYAGTETGDAQVGE